MNLSGINGTVKLNNGYEMPYLGLGVFLAHDGDEVMNAVQYALQSGYRHIDTAALYENEKGVGEGIRRSGVPREDIFVTSKVWNSDQGYDNTLRAFDDTMNKLGFEYLDLYLIHWPVKGKYIETWKAIETIYKEVRIKSIGVSNFLKHHIEDLNETAEVPPMVNQVEFHPYLVQQDLIDYCKSNQIVYEAWSPLMQGKMLEDKLIKRLAEKYSKTSAQIIVRWDLQKGVVTIPKSVKKERIISNADIFDFEISDDDMKLIDSLDRHERIGADPDNFDF